MLSLFAGKEEAVVFWDSSGGRCINFGDGDSYGSFPYNGYCYCLRINLSQNVIKNIEALLLNPCYVVSVPFKCQLYDLYNGEQPNLCRKLIEIII